MKGKFVAYYRVSTARQGKSGLGLEAQREAVETYLNGGGWELIGEFTEVETGTGKDALDKRPKLKEAIALAKKTKATLVIAKLDRLARNVHFLTGLMESKVKLVCADMPEANELTLNLMACFAQHEAKRISERTRDALAAAKARGVKLGNPNIRSINKPRHEEARDRAEALRPMLDGFKKAGMTQRAMVTALNNAQVKTARGGEWKLTQLQRVLKRLANS